MIQYSLRDLLVGSTLVAMGLGALVLSVSTIFRHWMWFSMFVPQGLWLASGALIGAGALYPFKKPMLGAIVGVMIQFFIFLITFTTW